MPPNASGTARGRDGHHSAIRNLLARTGYPRIQSYCFAFHRRKMQGTE
jgi:hypothetical protein